MNLNELSNEIFESTFIMPFLISNSQAFYLVVSNSKNYPFCLCFTLGKREFYLAKKLGTIKLRKNTIQKNTLWNQARMGKYVKINFNRVAVTGGNGGLGNAIVAELRKFTEVVTLDLSINGSNQNSYVCDITSLDQLRNTLTGCDAIVHAAAKRQPDDPEDELFRINVLGTWNVLTVAKELGIQKVVFISSETASGIINISRVEAVKPDYLPIDEAHPLLPAEAYGTSKQVGEVVAESFTRDGQLEVVALRPTLILMPGWEDYVKTTREKDDIDLWSYVVVWDVARAVGLALQLNGIPFSVFYLSAMDTFSKEPTLEFMQRKLGPITDIRNQEIYDANPHAAIWDGSNAYNILGFEPKYDWRRFLAECEKLKQGSG